MEKTDLRFVKSILQAGNVSTSFPDKYESTGFTKSTSYYNHLRYDVVVTERSGVKQRLTNIKNSNNHCFIVRDDYYIPVHMQEELRRYFEQTFNNRDVTTEFTIFRDSFTTQYDNNKQNPSPNPGRMHIRIETVIPAKALQLEAYIYMTERDIVVSKSSLTEEIEHPFTDPVRSEERYLNLKKTDNGLTFFIEIVDNDSEISDRFFYIDQEVQTISPIYDPERESGVYFGIVNATDSCEPKTFFKHMSFDEAEVKLGLYRTREEAASFGDVETSRKKHILDLQHEITIEESKFKREKIVLESNLTQAKTDLTNAEQKLKITEGENQRLKAEIERRKMIDDDYFNRRSNDRKDSSEFIKFISTVVITGLGVWAVVMKSQK